MGEGMGLGGKTVCTDRARPQCFEHRYGHGRDAMLHMLHKRGQREGVVAGGGEGGLLAECGKCGSVGCGILSDFGDERGHLP